ncbi:hypothetical protein [Georgenia satyanarayanai]|uniref:hypothetical protein n=1 Tax=Georgenia satyanarayanai TaxID=860221 RepID=UPI001265A61B|nr:hypothetical protein [Georgenia satyanarayanai]
MSAQRPAPRWPRGVGLAVGAMMVGGAGVNTVLVTARPQLYPELGRWLTELSPWHSAALEGLWDRTFGEHPRLWGTLIGIGYEGVVGALSLSRDPRRRLAGLSGAALFKGGLLAMGLWAWALPWLAVLAPAIAVTARSVGHHDLPVRPRLVR